MATDTESTTDDVAQSESGSSTPSPAPGGRYRAQQLIAAAARFALRARDFRQLGEGLLEEIVDSIDGTVAGAIWLRTADHRLDRSASYRFDDEPLQEDPRLADAHGTVLKRFLGTNGASLWAAETEVDGLRLPRHLLLAPITLQGEPRGILEVTVDAERQVALYQSPVQLLGVIAGTIADWIAREERHAVGEGAQLAAEANDYAARVHDSLHLPTVCGAIANEARRHVRCDRASLAVGGASPRVRSVSGQVTIDHRANQVVALNALVRCVARLGDPLAYEGDASGLAPQIEQALDRYVDESFARQLLIYPLREAATASESSGADGSADRVERSNGQPINGALVVECFEAEQTLDELRVRAESILNHTERALSNAVAVQRVPLMPLWRALGRWTRPSALSKFLRVAALVAVAAAALAFWPVDFTIRAEGTLEPQLKREVFADIDGVVERVLVQHGQQVAPDQLLLELRSPDLDVTLADIAGQRRVAEEQALADERKMVDARVDLVERHRLAGSRKALEEQRRGLEQQQALLERKQEWLNVRSRFAGEVITWDATRRLLHRPVKQGDRLLTIADPDGPWELELFIQDRRLGHVLEAARESNEPLQVEFILATHPTERFVGELREVHEMSQNYAEQGWGALAHVDLDRDAIPELRSGAKVSARVVCGRRSLGFAWFHELAEWFASHVFF